MADTKTTKSLEDIKSEIHAVLDAEVAFDQKFGIPRKVSSYSPEQIAERDALAAATVQAPEFKPAVKPGKEVTNGQIRAAQAKNTLARFKSVVNSGRKREDGETKQVNPPSLAIIMTKESIREIADNLRDRVDKEKAGEKGAAKPIRLGQRFIINAARNGLLLNDLDAESGVIKVDIAKLRKQVDGIKVASHANTALRALKAAISDTRTQWAMFTFNENLNKIRSGSKEAEGAAR